MPGTTPRREATRKMYTTSGIFALLASKIVATSLISLPVGAWSNDDIASLCADTWMQKTYPPGNRDRSGMSSRSVVTLSVAAHHNLASVGDENAVAKKAALLIVSGLGGCACTSVWGVEGVVPASGRGASCDPDGGYRVKRSWCGSYRMRIKEWMCSVGLGWCCRNCVMYNM
eukprot:6814475-Ditylum_brightwellii.AAC.1